MTMLSRREFVRGVGAAVAGGALLAGSRVRADQRAWRMHLATSSIHFAGLSLEGACEQVSKLGFEAIDIWDKFNVGNKHLDDAEKLGGEGLKQLLSRYNLKLSAFTVYMTSYAKYAALLGAAGGGVAVRASAYGKFKPEELTAQMKKLFEQLKPDIELAEKYNGRIAIENHGGALLNTPDSFKAFVDLNPSPRVGVAIAPYHLQAINASVPDVIRTCGGQALFFYAWQKGGGFAQLPGHGPADFKPWIAALAEIQYRGYVNPFMHGHEKPEDIAAGLSKSRDYLSGIKI